MFCENMPVFMRETALRIYLEEIGIPVESLAFPLLCRIILSAAEQRRTALSEVVEKEAAASQQSPEQAFTAIRHVLETAWNNPCIRCSIEPEDFITDAVRWLLDTEKAYSK